MLMHRVMIKKMRSLEKKDLIAIVFFALYLIAPFVISRP